MSAGELFDLLVPAAYLASALLSTWVFASARKRVALPYAFTLALATLLLPVVVFPLYLAAIIWRGGGSRPRRWRYSLPLLYGVVVLSAIGAWVYFDSRTVDAHLARAARAKLIYDHQTVIREYRQALALEDNPHTHKLLAIELAEAGYKDEANAEFRLAQADCQPDDQRCNEAGQRSETQR